MALITKTDDKLVIERQKLNALLEITNSVNKNYKVTDLLVQFENVMKDYIGVSSLAFINNEKNWKCILNYGIKKDPVDYDFSKVLLYNKTFLIQDSDLTGFDEFDVLMPVFHKERALSYLLIGGIDEDEMIGFIQHHIGFVQTIANVVSVAIETKNLAKEVLKKKLAERDMQMAAEMQKLLLPTELPSNQLIDISATYIAKQMVSGDYYDFLRVSDTEYVFCIADVSGKGMSAAMLMSNFQATLRANVKYNHLNLTLEELVEELNRSVISAAKGEKFITFFIGYFNEKNRELKYINAGHNYPILCHQNSVRLLQTGCTALGIFEKLPTIESQTLKIETNTVIVCYTDGMVEVENEEGEQYQTERLSKSIEDNKYLNMEQMNKAIFEEIAEFRKDNEFPDDTAVLSLRII